MNELLQNSALLLIIITLLYVVITGLTMTERMRVILVYIFSFALAFAGSFSLLYIAIGTGIVLLLALEFLSDDEWRLKVFTRLDYKIVDFLYRMFIEYAYAFYLLSFVMLYVAHHFQAGLWQWLCYSLAIACITTALFFLTAKKYVTKKIDDIIEQFQKDILTYDHLITPHMQTFFGILVTLEDHAYFARSERQHTIPLSLAFRKGLLYLRKHRAKGSYSAVRSLFSRGYGTIEMQLLRSIGIEFGYNYTVRRKIFEILYANMLFNGYLAYLKRARGNYYQYRNFILLKYIQSVNVRVNGRLFTATEGSSLLKMYGKQKFEQITKEEFFVWCLGLPQRSYIPPEMVAYYDSVLGDFGISLAKVNRILAKFE